LKLIVTEKERMAQNIARALGNYSRRLFRPDGGTRREGRRASGVYVYDIAGEYAILPLSGHIMGYVTSKEIDRWSHASVDSILSDPKSLLKIVLRRSYSMALRALAREASEIIIATDSDEEGENIGLEVLEIIGEAGATMRSKRVSRLWLTTTMPEDIRSSFSRLRSFNFNLAKSVEARRKVDAIVGFSGTRELTLSLKKSVASGRGVLSFGRVQTSTLWLVVEREREILSFVPRPFWEIKAKVKDTTFLHASCPFFDKAEAFRIYERVKDAKEFFCDLVEEKESEVNPPKPLNTSEMLKVGSSLLHLSPSKVMSLAEDLYLSSLITYPRVDNRTYSSSFNHEANLEKLSRTTSFGEYAKELISKKLTSPSRGRFSEDHEPITPINGMKEDQKRNPLEYRLYELILRHYLSIFGPKARFLERKVKGTINGEVFKADGRTLIDKGFYAIYYFPAKEKSIDSFSIGSKHPVKELSILEGKTEPPPRYTQSGLLSKMEQVGIGTKSTRPGMIETLKSRNYIRIERAGGGSSFIRPTERGMKLIEIIERPWGRYISPEFTARVEEEMEKIAQGRRDWEELVSSERKTFAEAISAIRKIRSAR
jgi:DNA topoisomerase-1